MKKAVKISAIVFLSLLILLFLTPFIFKGKIRDIATKKMNESVNAQISYRSFSLSIVKSFPDLTATFNNLSIVGKGEFSADTLMVFKKLSLKVDIASAFKKSSFEINSIVIDDPTINLIVNQSGKANWDIAKESTSSEIEASSTQSTTDFKFSIDKIAVNKLNLKYTDKPGAMAFAMLNSDVIMDIKLAGMKSDMNIKLNAPSINFEYDSVNYIDKKSIEFATKLVADFDKLDFQFVSSGSKLNELPLELNGGFSMPSDSMLFDLKFGVPQLTMKQLFDLIPASYSEMTKGIDASGDLSLKGNFKGVYYNEEYPAIDVAMTIDNGSVKTKDLPDALRIKKMRASVSKPQGSLDSMVAGIQQFDVTFAGNPFSMHANFSNLFIDPFLDISIDGTVDLNAISKFIPIKDTDIKGLITAIANIKGNMSAIEKSEYTRFVSKGNMKLRDFYMKNPTLPQGVTISSASALLNNQQFAISELNARVGRSDFALSGKLDNVISYAMNRGDLNGAFSMSSSLIDVNQLMSSMTQTVDTSATASTEPIEFPAHVALTFDARINKLIYDKIDITNFKGRMLLANQKLTFDGVEMDLLTGHLGLKGTVIADGRKEPLVDMNMSAKGLDFPAAFSNVSMVQNYMPLAAKSEGKFSTDLHLNSIISSNLSLISKSVTAIGNLSSTGLRVVNSPAVDKISNFIRSDKLRNIEVKAFLANFEIKDGTLNIKPFSTGIAGQPTSISGTYNLGGIVNFKVDTKVDKDMLSADIQKSIGFIPGGQNMKTIDIGLAISGDAKNPDIKVDYDKLKKQVIDQVKKSSPEEIKNAAKKLINNFLK